MNYSQFYQQVRERAVHKCVTCGSSVGVYSADEGTGSYEPIDVYKLLDRCERLEEAVKSAHNLISKRHGATRPFFADKACGKEILAVLNEEVSDE